MKIHSILKNLMIVVGLVLICSSCTNRQFMKYKMVMEDLPEFSFTARLNGTYHRHKKINVGSPYELFVSIRPKVKGEYEIIGLQLVDSNGNSVLARISPKTSKEESSREPGYFYYVKVMDLNLDYQEYLLKFEVQRDGVVIEAVEVLFEKDYSKQLLNNWWEDASSV